MKRTSILALVGIMLCSMLLGVTARTSVRAADELKVGMVTDVGQLDDRSFNASIWEGVQKGAEAAGGVSKAIETQKPTDYAANIAQFVSEGYNIVVTAGFALGDATIEAAQKNPKVMFIAVDVDVVFAQADKKIQPLPNLIGIIYPEDKAGFLAGVLAARLTKSKVIGDVLGYPVPAVVRFNEGYRMGAKYADPSVEVKSVYYPGTIDKAFNDPAWGAQTAGQLIDQKADVIFGAGGGTGNGALIEVAKRVSAGSKLFCIGVDTDQWASVTEAHPCLVSSAEKLLAQSVSDQIQAIAKKTAKAGNVVGGFGLAPFHDFDKVVPDAVKTELEAIKKDLEAGKIKSMPDPTATPAATAAPTAAK